MASQVMQIIGFLKCIWHTHLHNLFIISIDIWTWHVLSHVNKPCRSLNSFRRHRLTKVWIYFSAWPGSFDVFVLSTENDACHQSYMDVCPTIVVLPTTLRCWTPRMSQKLETAFAMEIIVFMLTSLALHITTIETA